MSTVWVFSPHSGRASLRSSLGWFRASAPVPVVTAEFELCIENGDDLYLVVRNIGAVIAQDVAIQPVDQLGVVGPQVYKLAAPLRTAARCGAALFGQSCSRAPAGRSAYRTRA